MPTIHHLAQWWPSLTTAWGREMCLHICIWVSRTQSLVVKAIQWLSRRYPVSLPRSVISGQWYQDYFTFYLFVWTNFNTRYRFNIKQLNKMETGIMYLEKISSWQVPGRCGSGFNTCRPRQNGRHFADDIFMNFASDFTEVCSWGSN